MLIPNILSLSKWLTYYCLLLLMCFILLPDTVTAQEAIINGTILHERTNEPLIGANVLIEDTRLGAATNIQGEYTIRVPAARVTGQEISIIARFIGFRTERRRITLTPGDHTVNFVLREDVLGLDEVVVTGQAIGSSRREIGSAVASINAEELELAPIQNLAQMLLARAPGVSILGQSGQAGGANRILLRGIASLSQSNTPIIYIDGVRIDNSTATGMLEAPGRGSGQAWAGLDDLNPRDIERIEIVRGASAATMYGTEAAAGVIQIFTKRGREGISRWNYRTEYGYSNVPESWWKDSGSVYAPWFANTYARTAPQMLHQLSVSGGTEGMRYYVSGNVRNTKGVLPNNHEDYYAIRSNIQANIRENLSLGFNMGYSDRQVRQTPDGNNQEGITINALVGGPSGQFNTVDAVLELEQDLQAYRFTGSVNLEHSPFQNFTHRLTTGLDFYSSDNTQFIPPETIGRFYEGWKRNYRRNSLNMNLDYIATYRARLSSILRSTSNVGFQSFSRKVNSNLVMGSDFPFFGLSTVSAASSDFVAGESRFEEKSLGLFAEQQFGLYDLLYVTFGLRGDAHSAFGAAIDYQLYPKVDISYILSEHSWWNDRWGSLRLRGSYGTAGMQPGAFDAIRTWSPIAAIGGVAAVTPNNVGNADLEPEISHEYELGFDAGLLKERVNLEVTYYFQKTERALHFRGLPPSMGFLGSQLDNIGEVENEGLEIAARSTILRGNSVRWTIFGNIAFTRNKVITLGGGRPINTRWTQFIREGFPIASFFGDRWVETTDDEGNVIVVRHSETLERDEDGNLPEDWDFIGSPQPKHSLQFGTDVNIGRSWSFNILFDYQSGHYTDSHTDRWLMDDRRNLQEDVYYNDKLIATAGPVSTKCRNPETLDPVTRMICETAGGLSDGDFVVPADFMRLREVSIAYRLPTDLIRPLGFTAATINFSGRNLWRWNKSDILEVEANLSGHSTHQRHSYFPTPQPQQYIFGLSMQF